MQNIVDGKNENACEKKDEKQNFPQQQEDKLSQSLEQLDKTKPCPPQINDEGKKETSDNKDLSKSKEKKKAKKEMKKEKKERKKEKKRQKKEKKEKKKHEKNKKKEKETAYKTSKIEAGSKIEVS